MNFFRDIGEYLFSDPGTRIAKNLQRQPLMVEHWRAEDHALEEIFDSVSDPTLNGKVDAIAEKDYQRRLVGGQIRHGQEDTYRELCLRNARRTIWEYDDGLQEELATSYTTIWEAEMRRLGVYDKFQELYVSADGQSQLITTHPDTPYFNE